MGDAELLSDLKKDIYGNGHDGLKIKVNTLEGMVKTLEDTVKEIVEDKKWERRMSKTQLFATVGAFVILLITILLSNGGA